MNKANRERKNPAQPALDVQVKKGQRKDVHSQRRGEHPKQRL